MAERADCKPGPVGVAKQSGGGVPAWSERRPVAPVSTPQGQEEPDGEDFNVDPVEDGPRPFYCLLDAGLKRTSTGSKTFAALKVGGGTATPVRPPGRWDSVKQLTAPKGVLSGRARRLGAAPTCSRSRMQQDAACSG